VAQSSPTRHVLASGPVNSGQVKVELVTPTVKVDREAAHAPPASWLGPRPTQPAQVAPAVANPKQMFAG